MEPRYYHVLVFGDGQQDKLVSYGEDRAKAAQDLTDMIQNGGPNGIMRVIFVGTKKLVEIKPVFPKAWHKAAAESAIANTESQKTIQLDAKRDLVLGKIEHLKKDAEAVGIDLVDASQVPAQPPVMPDSVVKALQDNGIDPNSPNLAAAIAAKLAAVPQTSAPASNGQSEESALAGAPDSTSDAAATKAKGTKAKGKDAAADAPAPVDGSEAPNPSGDLLAGT